MQQTKLASSYCRSSEQNNSATEQIENAEPLYLYNQTHAVSKMQYWKKNLFSNFLQYEIGIIACSE